MTDIKLTHHPHVGWGFHFDTNTETVAGIGYLTKWGARRAAQRIIHNINRKKTQQ